MGTRKAHEPAVSERQRASDAIVAALEEDAGDRGRLMEMASSLTSLAHEMSWEVRDRLGGRNRNQEIENAAQHLQVARDSLAWVDERSTYALSFELSKYIARANTALRHVIEVLDSQKAGAAA